LNDFIKATLISFAIATLFFAVKFILHPWAAIGVDSYALALPPLGNLAFQLILFVLVFLFLLITTLLAKEMNVKNYWLIPLVCIMTPLLFIKFAELENEEFIYALVPLIWLLYLLAIKYKDKLASIVLLLLMSGAFFSFTSVFSVSFLFPNIRVGETSFLLATNLLFILILGLIGLKKHLFIAVPTTIILLLSFLQPMLAIAILPTLAIGLTLLFESHAPNIKKFDLMELLAYVSIWGCIAGIIYIPSLPPTQSQWNAINELHSLAGSEPVGIDWDYVHWYKFVGGNVLKNNDFDADGGCCPKTLKQNWVLTRQEFDSNNCQLLRLYADANIWRCNV